MRHRTLVRIVLVLGLVVAVSSALGGGAHALPVPSTLEANISTQLGLDFASPATDSIAGSQTFTGNLFWNFDLENHQSPDPVSSPAISVASGYDPSLFFANGPFSTSAFPFVLSQPSLDPQSDLNMGFGSSITTSGQLGCDTARSMTPAIVPPGGTEQTITFTIRCADPTVSFVDGGMDLFAPCDNLDALCTGGPSTFTDVAAVPPSNLGQGEQWSDFINDPSPSHVHFGYDLFNLVPGKQYTVALVVQAPNPYPVPIAWVPGMGLGVYSTQSSSCGGCAVPSSSLTVPVPSLDGPTPGAGAVTFSAGEAHLWNLHVTSQRNIGYGATDGGGIVYAGPAGAAAGQQVTFTTTWYPGGDIPLDGTPVTFTLGSQSCTGTTTNGFTPNAQESCTITLTQPVGSYTLKMFSPGDRSVYPESATAPFSITGPTSTDQCKNGGWRVFGIFKNQGDCVSYVATGGKNAPAGGG